MIEEDDSHLQRTRGIGGWLILVAIGLIVSPIQSLWFLVSTITTILEPGTWQALTTPGGESYHPLWQPVIFFEIAVNVVFFLAALVSLYLFYTYDRSFPKLIIGFYTVGMLYQIADHFLGNMIPAVRDQEGGGPSSDMVRTFVACLIWIPYFLVSKRVKATFTR